MDYKDFWVKIWNAGVSVITRSTFSSYIASSLKQQSTGRRMAPLGHIIMILIQPVFALSP